MVWILNKVKTREAKSISNIKSTNISIWKFIYICAIFIFQFILEQIQYSQSWISPWIV